MFAAARARRSLQENTCCLQSDGTDPWLQCSSSSGAMYNALSLAQSRYEWSLPICEAVSDTIQLSMHWCKESHTLFPRNFRRGVWCVCMLKVLLQQAESLPMLPGPMIFGI